MSLEAQFGRDSDERLDCVVNPALYTDNTQGVGISRAARSDTANLITLTLAAINAGQIEADGADVKLGYTWNTDAGRFRISADYTHVRQYVLKGVPGLELGLQDTGLFDAAGTSGNGLHVTSSNIHHCVALHTMELSLIQYPQLGSVISTLEPTGFAR